MLKKKILLVILLSLIADAAMAQEAKVTSLMADLAREIGEMEPDDPVRAVRLNELYTLTELTKSLKTERN